MNTGSFSDETFRIIRTGNVIDLQEHFQNTSDIGKLVKSTRWSGFTILHRAAGLGVTDICEVILNHGADVNTRSVRGWYTSLHIALANGYIDTGSLLIERGANPWTKSKYGEDAFDYGIKRGFKRVVEEFRSKIMKIEMTNNLKRHKDLLAKQESQNQLEQSGLDVEVSDVLSDEDNV